MKRIPSLPYSPSGLTSPAAALNVGRYYFRVQVETKQVFDIYYDRAMKNVDDRKGQWFIFQELEK